MLNAYEVTFVDFRTNDRSPKTEIVRAASAEDALFLFELEWGSHKHFMNMKAVEVPDEARTTS